MGRFDIVRRDYYSPVPDLSRVPETIWTRPSDLGGVRLAPLESMEFIERELAPFIAELDIPVNDPGVPGEFFLSNHYFEAVDAELLYAMVRAMRPARVIELGSGYTTLLINMACRRNANAGVRTVHDAFDPYPREHILGAGVAEPTSVSAISATEVPLQVFSELRAGDVLFVDTTHTVKLASDVNFVILDVLPRLRDGVLVHFHDIFLPWEYPRGWFTEMQCFWSEQYLLQAFLAYNREFEVLVPAHALAREHPERLRRAIPSFADGVSPGSMWLRRTTNGVHDRTSAPGCEPGQCAATAQSARGTPSMATHTTTSPRRAPTLSSGSIARTRLDACDYRALCARRSRGAVVNPVRRSPKPHRARADAVGKRRYDAA